MAKFAIMASELKSLKKSMEDSKLAELKKEIIEILKKQDEKDFKKAIDYFESQELHFTHLEKSLNGKWIEKAGYGIGTVRIWKGKKYKKIAPGKWARVFEKEGRGTNIAIGKLIARVQKIDNVEDLMAFVMANKQRFVDENGVDLPVLDKLRAAVDAKNNGDMGSSKTNEKKTVDYSKMSEDELKELTSKLHDKLREKDYDEVDEEMEQINAISKQQAINFYKTREKHTLQHVENVEQKKKMIADSKAVTEKELARKEKQKAKETNIAKKNKLVDEVKELKHKISAFEQIAKELDEEKPVEKKGEVDDYKKQLEDVVKEELVNQKEDIASLYEIKDRGLSGKYAAGLGLTKKDKETSLEDRIQEAAEWLVEHPKGNPKSIGKMLARVELAKEYEKNPDWRYGKKEEEPKKDSKIDKEAAKTIQMYEKQIEDLDNKIAMMDNNPSPTSMRFAKQYEKQKKEVMNDLENYKKQVAEMKEKESETEKHQKRSDAMKGNQNAKKYGLTDEQIERYDIQEVVEDVNGYGIVKNSEGKYSYIDDGRVKDRPDDFETSIEKVKERINDTYETKKNIQAAKDYDFKNAKLGSDIEYTKRSDGKHLYFKKSPDGSKAISVTVEVSDMREPLNMTYEVSDTKSGESWQYETAYGNKEGLEWAVEKPEQMEKELKKFFKRDPNKEWEKQNTFEKESVIDRSISTNNPEKLKPIAKSESVGEGKVKIPYSKEVSDEIKHLTNTSKDAVTKGSRYDFLTKIYYDKGNLVSTDGNKLKIVKVGELDGIDNGTFVDIDNSKEGITITADKEFTKEHKFPQYERVIPDGNNEKIVLDNKALISKIKDLKKDGGITKKDSYVTMDIQGNNLMLDGVKVGDVSAANFEGENSDYINLDADILTSYLSGDKTDLYSSKDSSKAMYFGNGSAINIIMPQRKTESHIDANGKETIKQRRKDYESMRKDKEIGDEAKANKKAAQKLANQGYVDDIVNGYKRSVPADFEEKSIKKIQDWDLGTLERMYKVANADVDSLMDKKDFKSGTFDSFVYKNYNMSPHNFIGQNYAMKEHPAIVRELERLIKEKGGKIEKSLFDDFIVDVFAADDEEEIEDELYEGETEYNDYSAEQPELFNSTSMKVREALDRIKNQVL